VVTPGTKHTSSFQLGGTKSLYTYRINKTSSGHGRYRAHLEFSMNPAEVHFDALLTPHPSLQCFRPDGCACPSSRAVYNTNRRSPLEPFYPRRARPGPGPHTGARQVPSAPRVLDEPCRDAEMVECWFVKFAQGTPTQSHRLRLCGALQVPSAPRVLDEPCRTGVIFNVRV